MKYGKLLLESQYLYDKECEDKEYNKSNNIIYEIKNGKNLIKEYDDDGELLFEGEYLYGKRNGKGIEYYFNGQLKFEGEYLYDNKIRG